MTVDLALNGALNEGPSASMIKQTSAKGQKRTVRPAESWYWKENCDSSST